MLPKRSLQLALDGVCHAGRATSAVHRKTRALVLILSALALISGCDRNERTVAQEGNSRPRRVGNESGPADHPNDKKMTEVPNQEKDTGPSSFYPAMEKALARRQMSLANVCDTRDPVSRRVLEDYGAMFVASESVMPPPVCVFKTEVDVEAFHKKAKFSSARIGGSSIDLQPAAMQALLEARQEATEAGLNITPRGGTEAARRSFDDTRRLWDTRFLPALVHWQRMGRLSKEQAARLRALPLDQQVGEVLELEKKGIFFSKDLSKSILYSIAAPGTSQHIAMLALDVTQFADVRVRRILARHGWFQTVKSDLPHFTFLGVTEERLPALGLVEVMSGKQKFWIPNVTE